MAFFAQHNPPPAETPQAPAAHVMVVPRYDVQWNRPVFRAPALTLPTSAQIWSEIPFTAQQFRGKDQRK